MKKICIYNNKGGVGKTTSVINIAYAMHKVGKKVLVVDCDMQQNCINFLFQKKLDDVSATKYSNIHVTTYDDYKKNDDESIYDFVIFDLPPTFSEEVQEIINSSDKVMVPMMLGRFEINGLKNLTSRCGNKLGGVFVTMYKKRDEELLDQIKSAFSNRLCSAVIPYSDTIRDSQKYGMTLEEYFEEKGVPHQLKNAWKAVDAYALLTEEIVGGAINENA